MHELRRSDRISLSVPIQVTGTDISARDFLELANTIQISRHGATIVVPRQLAAGQHIMISYISKDQEARFRVVGLLGGECDAFIYGVALLEPEVNFWGIEFPPVAESDKAVGRMVLECGGCHTRALAYLNEIELEVFESNRTISRECKKCNVPTVWKAASLDSRGENVPSLVQVEAAAPPGIASPARLKIPRKDPRARIAMKLCIRQPGFPDEVATSEDVSRGGVCFDSRKRYPVGSRVELAVPYTEGGTNIFVPACIAYVREVTPGGFFRHGAAYIKGHGG